MRGQREKKRLKPDSSAELHRVTEIGPGDVETILGNPQGSRPRLLDKSKEETKKEETNNGRIEESVIRKGSKEALEV